MADGAGPATSEEIRHFREVLQAAELELEMVRHDIRDYGDEIELYGSSATNLSSLEQKEKALQAEIKKVGKVLEILERGGNVSANMNAYAKEGRRATLEARKGGVKNNSLRLANKIARKKSLRSDAAAAPPLSRATGFEELTRSLMGPRAPGARNARNRRAPNLTKKIYNARVSNWQAMKNRKPVNWARTLEHMNNATYKALRRSGLKGPLAIENARKEVAERLVGPEVRGRIREYSATILRDLMEARGMLAQQIKESNDTIQGLVATANREDWGGKGGRNGGEAWKTAYGTLKHGTTLWRDTITPNVYRIREAETEAGALVKGISQLLEAGRIEEADKGVKKLEGTIEAGVQVVEKVSVSLKELEETFASIKRRVARARAAEK